MYIYICILFVYIYTNTPVSSFLTDPTSAVPLPRNAFTMPGDVFFPAVFTMSLCEVASYPRRT